MIKIMKENAILKTIILLISIFSVNLCASNIQVIPSTIKVDKKKVKLGEKLFNDKRLSLDNSISCASCHILNEGGDDNTIFAIGINGKVGNINTPTVLNSTFNFRQFWDGRAKNLKEQALGPIENPIEMGSDFNILIKKLANTEYKELFGKIYKDGITKKNIADSIAEYEKTLITPNSPFDRYLKGEKNAITEKQKEGYELFKNKGCVACHNGVNIGGNLYSKFGVLYDAQSSNLGRYHITKKEKDKYYFKVPTLRNIEHTAPYFHDGRTFSLHDTVKIMALYQIGRPITDDEVDKIVSFLYSLSAPLFKEVE